MCHQQKAERLLVQWEKPDCGQQEVETPKWEEPVCNQQETEAPQCEKPAYDQQEVETPSSVGGACVQSARGGDS